MVSIVRVNVTADSFTKVTRKQLNKVTEQYDLRTTLVRDSNDSKFKLRE
jgi:hypothetical protein